MEPVSSNNSSFSFRRATSDDASLLAQLGATLFEQTFGAANRPEDMAAYLAKSFTVERELELFRNPSCAVWIAENATGSSVGYAVLVAGTQGDGVAGERPAEIQRIYADRSMHGTGLGGALMDACIAQARAWQCDVIWLGVWEENPRAIAFYEKRGFRRVGRQLFVLGEDLQHDLVMALTLA